MTSEYSISIVKLEDAKYLQLYSKAIILVCLIVHCSIHSHGFKPRILPVLKEFYAFAVCYLVQQQDIDMKLQWVLLSDY
jgi:hypothetical protein